MELEHTTSCKLSILIASFMEEYNASNLFTPEDYTAIEKEIEVCDDLEQLNNIAVKMFKEYLFMPPELGVKILRRFLQVSPDREIPKAFLGQWLFFYGMEGENDREGVRLLEEVVDANIRDAPWNT